MNSWTCGGSGTHSFGMSFREACPKFCIWICYHSPKHTCTELEIELNHWIRLLPLPKKLNCPKPINWLKWHHPPKHEGTLRKGKPLWCLPSAAKHTTVVQQKRNIMSTRFKPPLGHSSISVPFLESIHILWLYSRYGNINIQCHHTNIYLPYISTFTLRSVSKFALSPCLPPASRSRQANWLIASWHRVRRRGARTGDFGIPIDSGGVEDGPSKRM